MRSQNPDFIQKTQANQTHCEAGLSRTRTLPSILEEAPVDVYMRVSSLRTRLCSELTSESLHCDFITVAGATASDVRDAAACPDCKRNLF